MADPVDAEIDTRSQAAEEVAHLDNGEVEAEAANPVDAAVDLQAAGDVEEAGDVEAAGGVEAAVQSQAACTIIYIASQSMVKC